MISTKTHGKLDYIIGLILMSSPWIFNYASSDQFYIWIPFALGSIIILYSMLTSYEHGFVRAISMKMHLVLDFIAGVFLAASPWLLHFDDVIYLPHLIIGIALVIAAFASQKEYNHEAVRTPEVQATAGTIPETRTDHRKTHSATEEKPKTLNELTGGIISEDPDIEGPDPDEGRVNI